MAILSTYLASRASSSKDARIDGLPYGGILLNRVSKILLGNDNANQLTGTNGNDVLIGGAGADTMAGGLGNDRYFVDNLGDVVTENANAGIDTVLSSVNYTLGANLENLNLTGEAAINGTGNQLNNILLGNDAANYLAGGAGNDLLYGAGGNDTLRGDTGVDTMYGGTGDDTYYLYEPGDVAFENADEGLNDKVFSTLSSYTMADNIELLALNGTGNIDGIGNALANRIFGNEGNNLLVGNDGNDGLIGNGGNDVLDGGNGEDAINGGAGNDVIIGGQSHDNMTGGAGADQFIFASADDSGIGLYLRDVINDFAQGEDILDFSGFEGSFAFVEDASFSGMGAEINARLDGGNTIIGVDVDGNGSLDLEIQLVGNFTLTQDDFAL